ncbi:MAG: hypothetical protein IJ636_00085 [Bacteroidales bacterium]|nr:hypothetical protein [Bacteroidales bacterium]
MKRLIAFLVLSALSLPVSAKEDWRGKVVDEKSGCRCQKLPSVDGTDGSEGMMEKRSGAASSWMRLLLLF